MRVSEILGISNLDSNSNTNKKIEEIRRSSICRPQKIYTKRRLYPILRCKNSSACTQLDKFKSALSPAQTGCSRVVKLKLPVNKTRPRQLITIPKASNKNMKLSPLGDHTIKSPIVRTKRIVIIKQRYH